MAKRALWEKLADKLEQDLPSIEGHQLPTQKPSV